MTAETKSKRTLVCLTPSQYEQARKRAHELYKTYSEYMQSLLEKDLQQAESEKKKGAKDEK